MVATFDYCLRNNLLGVGWRAAGLRNHASWEEFANAANQIYLNPRELQICRYMKKRVGPDDLIWTRSPHGQYYLAKVESGWEYWKSDEADELDIDVANIVRCSFVRVELDSVPGKVIACFRPTRALQAIDDGTAREYSKHLWNYLTQTDYYRIDSSVQNGDLFSLLDAEETEDLLFIFLQTKGWCVIPNSRKADTMKFEFSMVRLSSGETGAVQVKTGYSSIGLDSYSEYSGTVVVFQPNNCYHGTRSKNVQIVSRAEIEEFLASSLHWLPTTFRRKVEAIKLKIKNEPNK